MQFTLNESAWWSAYETNESSLVLVNVINVIRLLQFLQFDLRTNLNLAELSDALEKEVRDMEEDNATYQAAVVSYEQELRFLKWVCLNFVASFVCEFVYLPYFLANLYVKC